MKTLLVDFDIVAFKYGWTHEIESNWKDGTVALLKETRLAEDGAMQFIKRIQTKCKCDIVRPCITGSFNFRYSVLPTYKHNRQDVVKPELIDDLKMWARVNFDCLEIKGLEADDVMGIYGSESPDVCVVATIDKDLRSVPCTLYNWNEEKLVSISVEEADWWFHYQVIIGDNTDGYTGIPGAGEKKAKDILSNPRDSWWDIILDEYDKAYQRMRAKGKPVATLIEAAGGPEEYALQQARVARILRHGEYDFAKHKPILWRMK